MHLKKVLAFVLCLAVTIHGAFVDTLMKCSKDDTACHLKLMQQVLHDIGEPGVPEMGIPPIDPVHLKDVNASIANVVDVTLIEGVVKGAKRCVFNSFSPNFDKLVATLDITCDVTLKGKYKLASSSPVIKNLVGGDVHGEGNGKVKIEKLNVKLEIPYKFIVRDGDVFIAGNKKKLKYTFDVLGKVVFAADNLYVGDKESSASIIQLLNENWKILVQTFGKHFVSIAVDFVYDFCEKFLNAVATKHYIIEDLLPLAQS